MINAYSTHWFEQFLETRPYTAQELAFVCRCLPNPPYTHILDLCCGQGRHTNALAAAGYTMTGIDINPLALAKAQTDAPTNVTYRQQDMRHLAQLPGDFDAIICLWQSFGYFDAQTNAQILQQISDKLRRNGRFILDIYNREHFSWQTRTRMAQPRRSVTICETLVETAHRPPDIRHRRPRRDFFLAALHSATNCRRRAGWPGLSTGLCVFRRGNGRLATNIIHAISVSEKRNRKKVKILCWQNESYPV
ncbi:MAG: class I SAM-dependent methyltransferase [Chloroflexota bacterium]